MIKNKTILIAGGAGFIGANLVRRLLKHNTVTVADNLSSGKIQNLNEFFENKRFHFIQHDIREQIEINQTFDYIFNLASPASQIFYKSMPVDTLLTNAVGTYNLLNLAIKQNSLYFHASTSEVYGDPLIHPQVESYWGNVNPIGDRACYDEGKRFAEALITSYARVNKNLNYRIVRIFNTYGPGMDKGDGRVIPNFITQALDGKDITIYGKGEQTRSFCYVEDTIGGFLTLVESKLLGPVNIGNPVEHTVLQLAELIIKMTKSNSKIIYQVLPENDPKKRKPDITLAKNKLKWEPKIALEKGLVETIKWFS